jgi:hypothetical protein
MLGWQGQRIVDAVSLGVIGALSAQLFMVLLHGAGSVFLTGIASYQSPGLPEEGGLYSCRLLWRSCSAIWCRAC